MSELTATKCDKCGKTAFNVYEEDCWITLSSNTYNSNCLFQVRGGRTKNKNGILIVFKEAKRLDFCNLNCMIDYFRILIKEGKEKMKGVKDGNTI